MGILNDDVDQFRFDSYCGGIMPHSVLPILSIAGFVAELNQVVSFRVRALRFTPPKT